MSEIVSKPITVVFDKPLQTARVVLAQRRGFLHALEHDGKRYISESALLPEFGTEHFEHAERVLNGESMLLAAAPSTVFGLDCLRYALEQKDAPVLRVPIAKLLPGGTTAETIAQARQAYLDGFETVKLKVGFRDVKEDIELVNAIALEQPELVLRLDANLGWSELDVWRFAKSMKPECVEWIEDPFRASIAQWEELSRTSGLKFACDEAFREADILKHTGRFGFAALVLKPARMGAIGERNALLECMREAETKIVLSSMMDTSIGLAYLAHLAVEWSSLEFAHGLGTLSFLEADSLDPGLQVETGHLVVPPLSELARALKPHLAQEFGWL